MISEHIDTSPNRLPPNNHYATSRILKDSYYEAHAKLLERVKRFSDLRKIDTEDIKQIIISRSVNAQTKSESLSLHIAARGLDLSHIDFSDPVFDDRYDRYEALRLETVIYELFPKCHGYKRATTLVRKLRELGIEIEIKLDSSEEMANGEWVKSTYIIPASSDLPRNFTELLIPES